MKDIGLATIIFGACILVVGIVIMFLDRIPWFFSMPGDIHHQGKNWSFHFPVVTCILISVILTIILNLVLWLIRK